MLASLTLDAPASDAAAADGGAASGGEAAAAGGSAKGGKKEKEKAVLIFESKKNKGKKATVVRGLDAFGVKLSDASKVNGAIFLPHSLLTCLFPMLFAHTHTFSLACCAGVQEEVRERQHRVVKR